MKGWQPKKEVKSLPPINTDNISTHKLYDIKEFAYLVEQLNGLIDRYEHIYSIKNKLSMLKNADTETLNNVLSNIETAIEAITDNIIAPKLIVKTQIV